MYFSDNPTDRYYERMMVGIPNFKPRGHGVVIVGSRPKLKNRCVFFCDEFGTLPKIESAEMMFSASRSRRLQIVPIIQSFSQLDKNYAVF